MENKIDSNVSYPRTDYIAVGDETGVLFSANSFKIVKARAEAYLKRERKLFLYKRIDYGVRDPNSRPVPNMQKCDYILLSTLRYIPTQYNFTDTAECKNL